MKRFLRKMSWRFYHFVHTNGVVADTVYWGAFYVENFWRSLRFKRLSKHGVTPEELWEHRHLEPSSTLVTGVTNICNAKCTFCAYPKVVANKTLQTGVMSFEIFKKAVDEWSAAGGQDLDLTPVVGDPLVDPGLLERWNTPSIARGSKMSISPPTPFSSTRTPPTNGWWIWASGFSSARRARARKSMRKFTA